MHDHVIRLCICTCMYSNFEKNDMIHFRQEMIMELMRQQLLCVIHIEIPVHVKVAKKVYMDMGYKCTCTCTFMYYMMSGGLPRRDSVLGGLPGNGLHDYVPTTDSSESCCQSTDASYTCDHCGKHYESRSGLFKHTRSSHPSS